MSRLSASAALETGAVLTIDLDAVVANWRELAQRAAPAECSAVIKADAYGCGIEPVARALAAAGCRTFFVAHLSEARRARAVVPEAAIYVLNGLLPGSAPAYAAANLRPVLGCAEDIAEWRAFTAGGWRGAAALHVDTGMNRLGLRPREALGLAQGDALQGLGLDLVMSHFACADEPAHALNARQIAAFAEIRAAYPRLRASLANSSGIFLGPDAQHDMVRPGVALYGANPTPGHTNLMRPVVALQSRILQVRTVPAGETVGYGAVWTARRPTRLAVICAGYADGILRAAGASDERPGAVATVAGHPCPFAGRISMDLIAVDITEAPDSVGRGDLVALLDAQTGVDDLAAHAGTIGYEVLTSLGRRYRRVYEGETAAP